jgi:hypothetical protein
MAVLRVPEHDASPFRQYYDDLIATSVRRSAAESGKPHLRFSVRLAWIAAVVLLAVDLVAFGIDSWTTTVADVGVIVLTLVWFWVCVDDLIAPRRLAAA